MTTLTATRDVAAAPAPRMALLTAWILIVIGIGYMMVGWGGGWIGLYAVEFRIVSAVSLFAAVATWLLVALRRPSWRPRSFLAPAVAATLGVLVLTSITSWNPRFGLDHVAYSVLLAGAWFLLQRLFSHPFFEGRLGAIGVLLAFAIAGWYIVKVAGHWMDFWAEIGRLAPPPLRPRFEGLTYGNPSAVATLSILLWLASAAELGFGSAKRVAILVVLGAMTAFVVLVSGSRGAWLGLGIAAVVLVPVWLAVAANRRLVAALLASRRVKALVGVGLVATALLALAFAPGLISRIAEPASETRFAFYASALRMFAASPLVGMGPGNWTVRRITFTEPTEADYYIPHAHNIFLQSLAELGIAGLVAGAVVAVYLGLLIRLGAGSADPMTRRLAWATLAGGVYLLGHQLVDFYPNMIGPLFPIALIVARLDAHVVRERGVPGALGVRWVALLGLASVVAFGWLLFSERAALPADQAVRAANDDRWTDALEPARLAVAEDPGMTPYLFTLGLAEAHAGNREAALDAMRRAAEIDDYPLAWLNVARLELDLGNREAARAALVEAMRIGWQQPQAAVGGAMLWLELGDERTAVDLIAEALIVVPNLTSDPTWQASALQPVWEKAVSLALQRAPADPGYLIAAEARRYDEAQALAERVAQPDPIGAPLVAKAWSGDLKAFRELHRLTVDEPLVVHRAAFCRRIARLGQEENRGPEWECEGTTHPGTYLFTRFVEVPRFRPGLPGPNASWQYQYGYRRSDPHDALVPGLPHLEVTIL